MTPVVSTALLDSKGRRGYLVKASLLRKLAIVFDTRVNKVRVVIDHPVHRKRYQYYFELPPYIKEEAINKRVEEVALFYNKIIKKLNYLFLSGERMSIVENIICRELKEEEKLVTRNPLIYFNKDEEKLIRMIRKENITSAHVLCEKITNMYNIEEIVFDSALLVYCTNLIWKERVDK